MKLSSSSKYAVVTWLMLAMLPSLSWAVTYYVDKVKGNNSNDGLSWGRPTASVSVALSRCATGDKVMVAAGLYNEAIVLRDGVKLKAGYSSQGAVYNPKIYMALLSPTTPQHVVTGESISSAAIEGFYILNGKSDRGAGIHLEDCANMIVSNNTIYSNQAITGGGIFAKHVTGSIRNNHIHHNTASSTGGGLELKDVQVTLSGNTIEYNRSGAGGGVYASNFEMEGGLNPSTFDNNKIQRNRADYGAGMNLSDFAASLTANLIHSNTAEMGGGGAYLSGFKGSIVNCLFSKNYARAGAAIYANDFDPSNQVVNNTITENTGGDSEAVGGIYGLEIGGIFKNNILWDNGDNLEKVDGTNFSYSVTDNFQSVNDNLYTNPQFVNPAANDFRLAPTSPLIDRGTSDGAPANDLAGKSRTGGPVDIGAYEYTAQPTPVATLRVYAIKYRLGAGKRPAITQELLNGITVRIYNKADACISQNETSWSGWDSIWDNCQYVEQQITSNGGQARFDLLSAYAQGLLILGKNATDPAMPLAGSLTDQISQGADVTKFLRWIVSANGKIVPAQTISQTSGNYELQIIRPEYVKWSSTYEYYPFIYQAVGQMAWILNNSIYLPTGYKADFNRVTEIIRNGQIVASQFKVLKSKTSQPAPGKVDAKYFIKYGNQTINYNDSVPTR